MKHVQVFTCCGGDFADFNDEVSSVVFDGPWVHIKTKDVKTSFYAPIEVRVWDE